MLGLVLGFSPVGGDILFVASQSGSVTFYLALVILFFVAMITPVVLLYRDSGFAGFAAAPIRIAVTFLVVSLYLFVHIFSKLLCLVSS